MDDEVQIGKRGHYTVSDSGDEDDEQKKQLQGDDGEGHAEEKTANPDPGHCWSQILQEGDLESRMGGAGTSLNEQTINDRGPESYNFDYRERFAEINRAVWPQDVFGEPVDPGGTETFGVDESRLRKRKHPQLDAYPLQQEREANTTRQLRFKSPAAIYGDSDEEDDESPSKRFRSGGEEEKAMSAPAQHTAIGNDEQGNEWKSPANIEVRMFSVQSTKGEWDGSGDDEEWKPMVPLQPSAPAKADRPRKPPIPNDQKFCPRNMLRDDYTLASLLNTTVPHEMDDIYEIGEFMAKALGDLKPDTIMEHAVKLGKERALEVFRQTQEKEKSGGMNILSNYRRRTPGGVFLHFARQILEPADIEQQTEKPDERTKKKDDDKGSSEGSA